MASADAYAEILDKLADKHQARLAAALRLLEARLIQFMSGAPLNSGNLFDLAWAIAARPQIQALINEVYLSEVQSVLNEYTSVVESNYKLLSKYGSFTKIDPAVVSQLQKLSFQGFEAIANEYLDTISTGLYQSTLTGRPFAETITNLQGAINGVYVQADEEEAARLVEIAKNGSPKQAASAIEKLHTKFGRDRSGDNLARYSNVYVQDSLMQFNASITTSTGFASGAKKWLYYGSIIRDSRDFCKEHAGKTYTNEQIAEIWSGSWGGKAQGDPFIVRGGYNCRHHWVPVFD